MEREPVQERGETRTIRWGSCEGECWRECSMLPWGEMVTGVGAGDDVEAVDALLEPLGLRFNTLSLRWELELTPSPPSQRQPEPPSRHQLVSSRRLPLDGILTYASAESTIMLHSKAFDPKVFLATVHPSATFQDLNTGSQPRFAQGVRSLLTRNLLQVVNG